MMTLLNQVYNEDIFTLGEKIEDKSIDMILCDLPYGTTPCKWDSVIPFDKMWKLFNRIAKPDAAIVLTASQPFTSALIMSNPTKFKYSWTWIKTRPTGFANAKRQPLRKTEDVCVFGGKKYNPQGIVRVDREVRNSRSTGGETTRKFRYGEKYVQEFTNYPTNVLEFPSASKTVHPTQKPLELFEYLVRTYTNEGDTVFDPCVGSGTTALASKNLKRNFIVGDLDSQYCEITKARIG